MVVDETTDLGEAKRELERARGHVAALERAISAEVARRAAAGSMAPVVAFQKPFAHDDPNRLIWQAEAGDIHRTGT
jgi:hypothetical protein